MSYIIIRDNIHGDIHVNDEVIYKLINTHSFQRLRRINQLGGAQYVFIGANHNRFAHGLGVYHLISKFFDNSEITKTAPFNDEHNRLTILVAGLLHDIGHGPFSHTFERIGANKFSHEHYSAKIITDRDSEIYKILNDFKIDPTMVANIIEGNCKNNLMNILVSSQLDADRLDYLLRDSFNAGVSYSKVDVEWITRHSKIVDGKMVFPLKTMYAIEAYLLGRYYMYNQVYCHKTSLAFDATLQNWFARYRDLCNENYQFENKAYYQLLDPLITGKEFLVKNYLALDDYSLLFIITKMMEESDAVLADLSRRIIDRDFLEAHIYLEGKDFKKEFAKLKLDPKYYYKVNEVPAVEIYKTGDVTNKDVNIYICDSDGKIKSIGELSNILSNQKVEKNKKIIFIPKILI